jgi:hypothetical protein
MTGSRQRPWRANPRCPEQAGSPHDQRSLAVVDGWAPVDPALRLKRLREEHPDIEIIRRGPYEALIPEPDGQRVIVRWELSDLLDETEKRLAARDAIPAGGAV